MQVSAARLAGGDDNSRTQSGHEQTEGDAKEVDLARVRPGEHLRGSGLPPFLAASRPLQWKPGESVEGGGSGEAL